MPKHLIKILEVRDPENGRPNDNTIYEQEVDNLDFRAVVAVINGLQVPPTPAVKAVGVTPAVAPIVPGPTTN